MTGSRPTPEWRGEYEQVDDWRVVSFVPDVRGWQSVYLLDDPPYFVASPIAGWLIEERLSNDVEADSRERRVEPADFGDYLERCGESSNFWYLAEPGAVPDHDAATKERERRREAALLGRESRRRGETVHGLSKCRCDLRPRCHPHLSGPFGACSRHMHSPEATP